VRVNPVLAEMSALDGGAALCRISWSTIVMLCSRNDDCRAGSALPAGPEEARRSARTGSFTP
jgi:hypothetical protein